MNRNASRRNTLAWAGFLALFTCGPACVPNANPALDVSQQLDTENVLEKSLRLLALTNLNTPFLLALAERFELTSPAGLDAADFDALKAAVTDAGVVVADASALVQGDSLSSALFQAALATNTPIVLDNIQSAAAMAAAVGLGIAPGGESDADGILQSLTGQSGVTILAEQIDGGRQVHLTILGDSEPPVFAEEHLDEPDQPPPPVEPGAVAEPVDETSDPELPELLGPVADSTPEDLVARAETVAGMLLDPARPAILAEKRRALQDGSDPAGLVRRIWIVDFSRSGSSWRPSSSQSASLEVDFQVELYDSPADPGPDNKFLRIFALGPGPNPGELSRDENRYRYWFQDRIEIDFGPWDPDALHIAGSPVGCWCMPDSWSMEDAKPENANNVTEVTSSTEVQVGLSGDGPEGSYTDTQEYKTDLRDFGVVNESDNVRGRWDYKMTAIGGRPYNYSRPAALSHLIYTGVNVKFRELPNLAKNTFKPIGQVVWRAPGNFQERVNFRFRTKQTLTKLSIDHVDRLSCAGACFGACVCSFKASHSRTSQTSTKNFIVDFSAVND